MEEKKERNLRNVTQIGTPREENKIYIENLAYTRLKEDIYSAKSVFVLMGHTECIENRYITFVEAVISVNTIDFVGNVPKWNDYVWKDVFREIKCLYEDMIIVGWALDIKGMTPKVTPELESIHKEHFSGVHQLLFLMDTLEGEETIYVPKGTKLTEKDGFYIYYCTRAQSEYTEPSQNVETIPITRKKPNQEQRKNVDRLIGLDKTIIQERQEALNDDSILQMHSYEQRKRKNRMNNNGTCNIEEPYDKQKNNIPYNKSDNFDYDNRVYSNTTNGLYNDMNQNSRVHSNEMHGNEPYHNIGHSNRAYHHEINNSETYHSSNSSRKYHHKSENTNTYNPTTCHDTAYNHELYDDYHKNSERKNYNRKSSHQNENPSVELDVNFAEWTSSRGGKYRQMLKENEQKKNNSSGTNAGIAIAVAVLAFVIGVGIYENSDILLEKADKTAEVLSGNAQVETQQTQIQSETQTSIQDSTQASTQTGTIPVEIISGEK